MPDQRLLENQCYQPAILWTVDQTAVLQGQFVPMYSLVIGFQWDPGAPLVSSDATGVPVRRKTPLLGQLPCLFLITTACCHPPLGLWSSDITHLCAPRDNFPLPCSDEGLCRHHLHLPLCRSCSEHFSWMQRFLYSSRGTRKKHFIALGLKLLQSPCKKVAFFSWGLVKQNNFCLTKWCPT